MRGYFPRSTAFQTLIINGMFAGGFIVVAPALVGAGDTSKMPFPGSTLATSVQTGAPTLSTEKPRIK